MAFPSTAEIFAFLREHTFLTPAQLQELAERIATAAIDGRTLGRALVDRNWLTAYQANQLLQGRGKDLLVGPYRLLDRLGEGGMGQVFKAHHASMDRVVALKIIAKDRVSDPVAVSRFFREARAVAKRCHPNIAIAFEASPSGKLTSCLTAAVCGFTLVWLAASPPEGVFYDPLRLSNLQRRHGSSRPESRGKNPLPEMRSAVANPASSTPKDNTGKAASCRQVRTGFLTPG